MLNIYISSITFFFLFEVLLSGMVTSPSFLYNSCVTIKLSLSHFLKQK